MRSSPKPLISWPDEFAKVIRCSSCNTQMDENLLRDTEENVPQPGYIGTNFENTGLLLIGQNPGLPKSLFEEDRPYTSALRTLCANPTEQNYADLKEILEGFVPKWLVHRNHFPLREWKLDLQDIAYCNLVRCRTLKDSKPKSEIVKTCQRGHLEPWLSKLNPACIVFVGFWARDKLGPTLDALGIRYAAINRNRYLDPAEKRANLKDVVEFVNHNIRKKVVG